MTYKDYLQSEQWQEKRKKVFERALKNAKTRNEYGICERCGYEPRKHCLQVHHKTYANLFNEPLEDLELLCPNCHKEETEKQDKTDFIEKARILQSMQNKDIEFEIKREIGVLHDTGKAVNKALNVISWNGAEEVFDLRSWRTNEDGTKRPLRGLTLSAEEVKTLRDLLNSLVGA